MAPETVKRTVLLKSWNIKELQAIIEEGQEN